MTTKNLDEYENEGNSNFSFYYQSLFIAGIQ